MLCSFERYSAISFIYETPIEAESFFVEAMIHTSTLLRAEEVLHVGAVSPAMHSFYS
jgi:hypothetical protein